MVADTREAVAEQLPAALETVSTWADGINLDDAGGHRHDAIVGLLEALDAVIALQILAEAAGG